jgi:photosystem II stability/assembly factor-like uncharacterized protein
MPNFVYAGAAAFEVAGKAKPAGGLYRLDGDSGRWDRLAGGLPNPIEPRCVAALPGSVVYAGTQRGVWRSDDAGATWRALAPLPGKEQLVWSILVHPTDAQTIYAGTQGTTIYRSRDGGASWTELSPPAPRGMVSMNFPCRVIRLAADAAEPARLYAALEVGGVMRSRDGGDSWEGCNETLLAYAAEPRLKSRIISDTETEGMMDSHALAVSAAAPGTVFLANRMGLWRSADGGLHWKEMEIGRFSPLTYARDVKVSRRDPKTMYTALSVAAYSDQGSLYRSRDLGATWQRIDHGIAIKSTLMVIAESPADPDRIWCATRGGQVIGTDDGGRSWREYRLPDGADNVYALAAA